jgi:hypothetical protein
LVHHGEILLGTKFDLQNIEPAGKYRQHWS